MITIRTNNIINWLVDRKLIKNNYFKSLSEIKADIKKAEDETNEFKLETRPFSDYDYIIKKIEFIQENDKSKDSYFRENYSVRVWKNIQSKFEYNNLIIAEYAECLNELANRIIPKLSTEKADTNRLKSDLESRFKNYETNLKNKEDNYAGISQELNTKPGDNLKLKILEEAVDFLSKIYEFSTTMKELHECVEFYKNFISHLYPSRSKCRALSAIVNNPQTTFFEYRFGYAPSVIGPIQDSTQKLLEDQISFMNSTQAIVDSDQINFDTEIDFGIEVEENSDNLYVIESIADATSNTELDNEVLNCEKSVISGSRAEGHDAQHLLDTSRGRAALMNDLIEIKSFFLNFIYLLDEQELAKIIPIGENPMMNTLVQKIFQNFPEEFRNIEKKKIFQFIEVLEDRYNWLNSEANNRLFMIRHNPGYIDRLLIKLNQMQEQINIVKGRIESTKTGIEEASKKLSDIQKEFKERTKLAKEISDYLKKNISKKINHNVNIVGLLMTI